MMSSITMPVVSTSIGSMPKLLVPQRAKVRQEGALDVLKQNLTALFKLHKAIRGSRAALATKTGVSDGSIGQMLGGRGNPTLDNMEKVANFFHLEVWELLKPGLDAKAVIGEGLSDTEKRLHATIETSMKALGIKDYKLSK